MGVRGDQKGQDSRPSSILLCTSHECHFILPLSLGISGPSVAVARQLSVDAAPTPLSWALAVLNGGV